MGSDSYSVLLKHKEFILRAWDKSNLEGLKGILQFFIIAIFLAKYSKQNALWQAAHMWFRLVYKQTDTI